MPKALLSLLLAALLAAPAEGPARNPDLAAGIALVKEGDFESAVVRLDSAVRRLEAGPKPNGELAVGYVYLGVAYLELDQELVARSRFREAAEQDPAMRLDPREFSPQVIRSFEAARSPCRGLRNSGLRSA